jgi:hypothetical protein
MGLRRHSEKNIIHDHITTWTQVRTKEAALMERPLKKYPDSIRNISTPILPPLASALIQYSRGSIVIARSSSPLASLSSAAGANDHSECIEKWWYTMSSMLMILSTS